MAGRAVALSRPAAVPGLLALLGIAALLIGPVAMLLGAAPAGRGLGPGDWAAVRFSLLQATLSAVASVAVGVPFARALARRRFRGRGAVVGLLGAPFILPVIVAILGLVAVWGRSGLVSDASLALGGPRLSIYGLTGVVLAHVFFNVPLVARLVLQGWQAVPAERFRLAAQLGLSPGAVFRWLEWPVLRAVVPGAFLLVFLLCMTSFAVALTLGGGPRATTIEVAIYQAIRLEFDLGAAARLALIQMGLCAALALLALGVARPAAFGRGLGRPPQRWDAPPGAGRALDAAVILVVVAFSAVPVAVVVWRGAVALATLGLPAGLGAAAAVSIGIAAASATLSVLTALALAGLVAGLPRGRAVAVEGAGLITLALSPFVLGTGLFLAIRPWGDPFAWALPVTALVNAAMSLPFALRALVPALARARADYGRLADSLGLAGWARFRLVTLPVIRPALGFGGGLAAALAMGDLGVIALFAPPDVATLPLFMYRQMGAYQMQAAAGTALILLALSLAAFWICDRGGRLGHPA